MRGHGETRRESVEMLKGEEEQETDEEDERVQVAPNMGAGGSHPQAMLDPEEEAVEEERGTRKLRWADCDDKEEEEGWMKKVMWLDCSDGELPEEKNCWCFFKKHNRHE